MPEATQNVSNVTTGKPLVGGAIQVGGNDATAPTDAKTTLVGFTPLGYISDDGVTNNNSPESDNIKAWGGQVVNTYQTEKTDTFTFTLIEPLRVAVKKFVYGDDNVTTSEGVTTITANADEVEEHKIVIDMIMTGNILKRIYIPRGKLTEIGEITYADESAVGYECTITALPDSEENTHYEFEEAQAA